MKRNVTPPTAQPEFPMTVKKGYVSVKIYEVKNRETTNYCVSYIGGTGRVRRNFADADEAKREANNIALQLAHGDMEALKLSGREKQIYVEAERVIQRTGIPLHSVAAEFARAYDILGHAGIVEAARFFKKHKETGLPDMPVATAVAKFAEAKAKAGMSALYLKDIRTILGRFAAHFECNIASIVTDDLRDYLNALEVSHVALNNHRRMIVVLFNFAKKSGWLRRDEETAADGLDTYKVKERDVPIYTPAEMARLLAHADEDFLPYVALIAFGGVRREELHKGLVWESINWSQGYLLVPAIVAKTGRKRKIDLSENLLEWLTPYRGRTGTIFNADPRKRMAKVSAASGVKWKRNALRHSFGSYRMEMVKNAGQVALEMGNSAAMVMKHYFEIVDARAAREYWNIRPVATSDRKIVALSR
ncbi:MAG: hypothetical protein JO354_06660 [Verrucomicrobia bacterium]|nr:hypothetical protein [Verrucomicrobiota bacterium]